MCALYHVQTHFHVPEVFVRKLGKRHWDPYQAKEITCFSMMVVELFRLKKKKEKELQKGKDPSIESEIKEIDSRLHKLRTVAINFEVDCPHHCPIYK